MNSKYVHRIKAADSASRQLVPALLADLQKAVVRAQTPIGNAVSFVVSAWSQEGDGTFVVQFSPLVAERLPALSGLPLLQAAKGLATGVLTAGETKH